MAAATFLKYSVESATDLLALHQSNPKRYPALLESSSCDAEFQQGRWDILFAFSGHKLELSADSNPATEGANFFDELQAWRLNESIEETDTTLPFRGGWFVYLAYEMAAAVEPVLNAPASTDGTPLALAIRVPCAVLYDQKTAECWVVGEPGHENECEQILTDLAAVPALKTQKISVENTREPAGEKFTSAVKRAKQYIIDGDIFQANLSRAWHAELVSGDPVSLFERLRTTNPAPFAAIANVGNASIISSSPERLVSQQGNRIDTRPIAGTRRRGSDEAEDADLMKRLIEHPKERAEHIMLIDLERNDLGRVSKIGTVKVDELMAVETYAHVHHIVSNVSGLRRDNVSPIDVVRAVYPGGTITGCPKVRCMQIIAELEGEGRGAYTGSLGYMNRNGDMDLNILIRSFVLHGNQLRWQAGAGIVADSDPDKELDETRAKARGLRLALEAE